MDLTFAASDEAFRQEVRGFLAAELTPELRDAGARCAGVYCDYDVAHPWLQILARRGWSVPAWPMEHGGTGWTALQHYIFDRELAEAGAPPITPNATHMVGPVIMAFGTPAQKDEYLPRIRSGEDWWAQGYSEPGSGSDLASLRCAAVREGEEYVINGQKIWTTHAHFSNRIFCLVRTRTEDKPQKGISFLLFDLDLPGIEIRPIISISGDHELNEVFFRNVRAPVSALLGAENDGWTVAKYLLQHERSHARSPLLRARLRKLRLRAREAPADRGGALIDDPAFAAKLAAAETRLDVFEIGEFRMLAAATQGQPPPSMVSSMMKVMGTELRQRLTELAVKADSASLIARAAPDAPHALSAETMSRYLNDRAASIYAGANEVQRNIVAGALLR